MDLQLQGKRALVTGSSSGIGEAIAKALAKEGAAVVVHGRRENEAVRVAKAIADGGGTSAVALGDLATDDGAAQVAKVALAAFAGIDIVVNNAGAYFRDEWTAIDPARWVDLYNQNVVSVVRIIQHFLPQMKERGWGRFIQIGSGLASAPAATFAAYGATKSAIVNLTVSLAKGLARTGVTANTVSPGPVLTPNIEAWIKEIAGKKGWHGEWDEVERRFVAEFFANLESIIGPRSFLDLGERRFVAEFFENPTGRIGRVEEVVDLVAFLASPRADYINGANLRVDGGYVPTTN
jgi:3-oxoacyl-[acyl-carrier protein] reductase